MAHISAYTILEGIRLKIADRLMKAPLGEVMGRRIGYLKNIIMDKVEDLEPPLAHMIPELTSNLLLPVAIFTWMMVIDWRMGLAVLIAPVLAMIPMFFLMRIITVSTPLIWRQITMSTVLLLSMWKASRL